MSTTLGPIPIRPRGGTSAIWALKNPILRYRELGIETDTRRAKVGDGDTPWNDLSYAFDEAGQVVAEQERAELAEQLLDLEIEDLSDEIINLSIAADLDEEALAEEITRAEGVEAQLTTLLSTEVTNRTNADGVLQGLINALQSALSQEVTDRNTAIGSAVAALVDASPSLLDTLNEIAAAIGDDPNFATTVANLIGDLDAILTSHISDTVTRVTYKGNWDQSTNTPTLADGVGTPGDIYRCAGANTVRNLGSGNQTWNSNDFAILNDSLIWEHRAWYDSGLNNDFSPTVRPSAADVEIVPPPVVGPGWSNLQSFLDLLYFSDTYALSEHKTDTTDAHDASAISLVSDPFLPEDDVQGFYNQAAVQLFRFANYFLADGKGYLTVGTGVDTQEQMAPGVNGKALITDDSQTVGLKYDWINPPANIWRKDLGLWAPPNFLNSGVWTGTGYAGFTSAGATNAVAWDARWYLDLVPGTWIIDVDFLKSNNSGNVAVEYSIDGGSNWVTISASVDLYAAAQSHFLVTSGNIVLTTPKRLDLRIRGLQTKNASSTAYYGIGVWASAKRTA